MAMSRAERLLTDKIAMILLYADDERELPAALQASLFVLRTLERVVDWENLSLEDEKKLSDWLVMYG